MTEIGIRQMLPDFKKINNPNFIRNIQYEMVLAGARSLYNSIRQSLIQNVPKATVANPKYKDTLVDAVLITKTNLTNQDRFVHAYGVRDKNSGTYRTRFFNQQTKDRYQKTYKGKKLKKKRFLGHVGGSLFFDKGVMNGKSQAQDAMIKRGEEFIQNYINKNMKFL